MALPTNAGTGLVTGRFIVGVADGADADFDPDGIPAQGRITFVASVPYVPDPTAAPDPVTILKVPIVGILDEDGYLCTPDPNAPEYPGARGLRLVATDDEDFSVTGWTWNVTYAFQPVNGLTPTVTAHSMALPVGSTVDLTSVVKVPSSTGIGIEQAEALAAASAAYAQQAATDLIAARDAAQTAATAAQANDAGVATLLTTGEQTAPLLNAKVDRGALTLSVADYPTPEAAVDAAYTTGSPLYWPPGNWATNAVIPNLHKVRNSGPGRVSRGSSSLSPDPSPTDTNTLYVDPTGSDLNDGLSPGRAFATFQAAFDALAGYGPVLQGNWVIQAAAGTYPITEGQHTLTTQSKNRVVIKGPAAGHPNIPTAIIDGSGGAAYQHGLSCSGLGVHAEFRDLKFTGFTAGPSDRSRIGVVAENESSVLFTNIHADGASWCGAYAFNTVRARVNGGVFTGCRSGFIANDTQCTVTNTIVRQSTEAGIYWSRGTQGHIDYATFEDNAIGLTIGESSRVDTIANEFKRNQYGIRTSNGGVYGEGGAKNNYNIGTPDAQVQATMQHFIGSGDSTIRGSAYGWMRVGGSRSNVAHTGTTAPTVLGTPYTIPKGMLTQQTQVRVFGIASSTTGSSVWVSFGGHTVTVPLPDVSSSTPFDLDVTLTDSQGGHRSFARLIAGQTGRIATATGSPDSSVDMPVRVGLTLGAAGNSVSIVRTDVSIL